MNTSVFFHTQYITVSYVSVSINMCVCVCVNGGLSVDYSSSCLRQAKKSITKFLTGSTTVTIILPGLGTRTASSQEL